MPKPPRGKTPLLPTFLLMLKMVFQRPQCGCTPRKHSHSTMKLAMCWTPFGVRSDHASEPRTHIAVRAQSREGGMRNPDARNKRSKHVPRGEVWGIPLSLERVPSAGPPKAIQVLCLHRRFGPIAIDLLQATHVSSGDARHRAPPLGLHASCLHG